MMRTATLLAALTLVLAVGLPQPADAHTLTYTKAKRAAQKRADTHAGQRTRVTTLLRQSRHRYYTQAKWTRTVVGGCKGCGYDPATNTVFDTNTTESCFAEIIVRFRSRSSWRVRTALQSSACF